MLLTYELRRGPGGLGIEIDDRNVIAELTPGGQAILDGLSQAGDVVVALDDVLLCGQPLADVMAPGRQEYTLTVERIGSEMEIQATLAFGEDSKASHYRLLRVLLLISGRSEFSLAARELSRRGFGVHVAAPRDAAVFANFTWPQLHNISMKLGLT